MLTIPQVCTGCAQSCSRECFLVFVAPIVDEGAALRAPVVSRELPVRLRFKIENGLHRARQALEKRPACRDLFRDLGAEGTASLSSLRFHLATPEQTRSICRERSAVLFSTLHGHEVGVCATQFSKIPAGHTAPLLLHEALHRAGLQEQPHSPDALRSGEVTALVREMCGS